MQLDKLSKREVEQLFAAILKLESINECFHFFEDLCTVGEIKSLSQRLEVAKMLRAGNTYTMIEKKTGASTATISRVKRCLDYGMDGYHLVLDRLEDKSSETGD